MKKQFKNTEYNKPILKVCPRDNIIKLKNKCTTDHCSSDSDCISGKCHFNSCTNDDNIPSIYLCSGEDEKNYMKCGLYAGMKSYNSKSCYSSQTSNNYCIPPSNPSNNLKYLLMAVGIFIILLVAMTIFEKIKKRNKHWNEVKKFSQNL